MDHRQPKPPRVIEDLTEEEKKRVKDNIPLSTRKLKEENELNALAIMDLANFTIGGEGGE